MLLLWGAAPYPATFEKVDETFSCQWRNVSITIESKVLLDFFLKNRGWRAEPPKNNSKDTFRLCNHIQPRPRLMATIFHEFEKDGKAVFLFIGF